MNPNGEPVSPSGSGGSPPVETTAPTTPIIEAPTTSAESVSTIPVTEPTVNPSMDPDIAKLQNAVDIAAQAHQEASAIGAPTIISQTASISETPQAPQEPQFGDKPTAAEASTASPVLPDVPTTEPSIGMPDISDEQLKSMEEAAKLIAEKPPVENEKTPADKLKEKISADIDAFLEEVTAKERVAA